MRGARSVIMALLCLAGSVCSLHVGAGSACLRTSAPQMQMQSWNPLQNLKQMADQRIATVSHCMLAAGSDMTIEDARKKIDGWKAEIGNDAEKFAEVARRESECPMTAAKGGDLGIWTRGKLSVAVDELIFQEDVVPVDKGGKGGVVRGPIGTNFEGSKPGLSLFYIHNCWEPMSTGVVGALFDPPDSIKNKLGGFWPGGDKDKD